MKIKNLLLMLGAVILTSCSGESTSSSSLSTSSITSSSSSEELIKTNDDFSKAKTTYVDGSGNTQPLTMNTLYSNQNSPHLSSLKKSRVLVVPFGFQDAKYQAVQTQDVIDRLKITFFGTPEEMATVGGWQSVKTYYETSSYGKLQLEGDVIPTWVVYDKATEGLGGGLNAAEYARSWYIAEYAKANHGGLGENARPISDYDSDGDGFLDLVWVVYSHPTVDNTTDWWAYVTYSQNTANKTLPAVKTLGWASMDWMDEGNFNGYDAHTFVHESGHTFGLLDYYDYSSIWSPMGGIDMMDHNLGDHNAFSKFTLGWTSPWVVDDTSVITLRPGTTTGDCFIIPSQGYNGTAFDEYLMFELVAPIGLNEIDYKRGYSNVTGYTKPGIRLTHVDARVYKNNGHDSYCVNDPENGLMFRVLNTNGGRSGYKSDADYWENSATEKTDFTLQSLIESAIGENDWQDNANYNATNDSLFTEDSRTFNLAKGWKAQMPSRSNLWNKAKTITGWKDSKTQTYTIDETIACNFTAKVLSIEEDAEYGYVAKVQVTKVA